MNMDSDFSLHLGKLVVECRWGLSPDSNSEYLFWCSKPVISMIIGFYICVMNFKFDFVETFEWF